MNVEQIHSRLAALITAMMDKGLRNPTAFFQIKGNAGFMVGLTSGGGYGEPDHWYDYPHGDTPEDAFGKANAIIAAMQDAKTRNMQMFMGALGKVIDLGRDNGIEVDFLNPLAETMKRLSENIITDQRPIAPIAAPVLEQAQ